MQVRYLNSGRLTKRADAILLFRPRGINQEKEYQDALAQNFEQITSGLSPALIHKSDHGLPLGQQTIHNRNLWSLYHHSIGIRNRQATFI